ncbi:MAG: hypothetical protein GKR89_20695 [Candidatus Latescibacteria bacterium]|nr:hypothetical protein [Candidatus Latescibacterota bacterium]
MRVEVREALGGTYHAAVHRVTAHYPVGEYLIDVEFGCAPDRVEELVEVVYTQIEVFKEEGPLPLQLIQYKESCKRDRVRAFERNSFWVSSLLWADQHRVEPHLLVEYPDLVDSLTAEDVQRAARQYLDVEQAVEIVQYPALWRKGVAGLP